MLLDEKLKNEKLDVVDFVKNALLAVSHDPGDNLKYTIVLSEIFRVVCEYNQMIFKLRVSDVTDFICEVNLK